MFRKYCGFQSVHSQFYICTYLLCVTRTTCFGLYFRPSSGPSITLLLAPGIARSKVIDKPEDGLK